MVAMLVVKNKNISILMKIHDFMKILGNEFLMYYHQHDRHVTWLQSKLRIQLCILINGMEQGGFLD